MVVNNFGENFLFNNWNNYCWILEAYLSNVDMNFDRKTMILTETRKLLNNDDFYNVSHRARQEVYNFIDSSTERNEVKKQFRDKLDELYFKINRIKSIHNPIGRRDANHYTSMFHIFGDLNEFRYEFIYKYDNSYYWRKLIEKIKVESDSKEFLTSQIRSTNTPPHFYYKSFIETLNLLNELTSRLGKKSFLEKIDFIKSLNLKKPNDSKTTDNIKFHAQRHFYLIVNLYLEWLNVQPNKGFSYKHGNQVTSKEELQLKLEKKEALTTKGLLTDDFISDFETHIKDLSNQDNGFNVLKWLFSNAISGWIENHPNSNVSIYIQDCIDAAKKYLENAGFGTTEISLNKDLCHQFIEFAQSQLPSSYNKIVNSDSHKFPLQENTSYFWNNLNSNNIDKKEECFNEIKTLFNEMSVYLNPEVSETDFINIFSGLSNYNPIRWKSNSPTQVIFFIGKLKEAGVVKGNPKQFNWTKFKCCFKKPDGTNFINLKSLKGKIDFSADNYTGEKEKIYSIIKSTVL